jgi:hypothetical protein
MSQTLNEIVDIAQKILRKAGHIPVIKDAEKESDGNWLVGAYSVGTEVEITIDQETGDVLKISSEKPEDSENISEKDDKGKGYKKVKKINVTRR